jgi:hypothetical protein
LHLFYQFLCKYLRHLHKIHYAYYKCLQNNLLQTFVQPYLL